ncbi:carbohydrate ABC transporter membrane protein 1 (CUT1 family) [Paenibacillus cellulosilyticus]|uniref:Carbohydrate ABC transporter membrane protein 1 (CUT1 family) n=1 Tax=Paenibacillus cellulosilyticus TaxID=375489 RepID=A0A2V2YUC7_9BACL|nr:ABC transporter permease subunit [Paenibacillus cellulosilyticus]PWW00861.1 carbohydrate ABC transporter membrane protein 1 (CUT1 family) [Paenibacillus cellulosilyticus]QKS47526.1 sugar ABC transporter permease [Paenibacillus cellulosilyticus]
MSSVPAKRNSLGRKFWTQRYLMLLTLPAVLWIIVFNYIPMYGIIIAFQEYTPFHGVIHSPWVGFDNFRELFNDPTFRESLNNTFVISIVKLVFGFPAPILLALMLNELVFKRFKRIVQSLSYLPYFVSWVLVVGLMYTLLDPETGVVSKLLVHLHLIGSDTMLMGSEKSFLTLVVFTEIWKSIGWNSIIYLAAIAGVDPQLYEAATVDGANRFRRVWHITLPALKPTIIILLILSVGGLINSNFDQLYLMQNSMTQDAANVLSVYSYKTGLVSGRFSYATAIGLFQSVVAFVLMYAANYSSRKITKESLF